MLKNVEREKGVRLRDSAGGVSCGNAQRTCTEPARAVRGRSGAKGSRAEEDRGETGHGDYERYAAAGNARVSAECNRCNREPAGRDPGHEPRGRRDGGHDNRSTAGKGIRGRGSGSEEREDRSSEAANCREG